MKKLKAVLEKEAAITYGRLEKEKNEKIRELFSEEHLGENFLSVLADVVARTIPVFDSSHWEKRAIARAVVKNIREGSIGQLNKFLPEIDGLHELNGSKSAYLLKAAIFAAKNSGQAPTVAFLASDLVAAFAAEKAERGVADSGSEHSWLAATYAHVGLIAWHRAKRSEKDWQINRMSDNL